MHWQLLQSASGPAPNFPRSEPVSSVFPGRLTCEPDGRAWELGSSDGAAPEPMGLSVVIRLGWPRSVRVMVVGTFKPDRDRGKEACLSQPPLSPPGEFLHITHHPLALPHQYPPQLGQLHPLSHSKRNGKQLCSADLSWRWTHTAESLRVNTRTLLSWVQQQALPM